MGRGVTGVELTDRADRAKVHVDLLAAQRLQIVRGDFYTVDLDGRFDVVVYWNGFGVGSDADQRRLLARIATEWLGPDGTALIDVFNPLVWASWDGQIERLHPGPGRGYHHELMQRVAFDPVTSTAVDTWWDTSEPDRTISQRLRCYSPADLRLLLEGTGMTLDQLLAGGEIIDPAGDHAGHGALLRDHHEYLAVLRTGSASTAASEAGYT